MAEQHLEYHEACKIIGRHGAAKRAAMRDNANNLWDRIWKASNTEVTHATAAQKAAVEQQGVFPFMD
jgi:hypothetical protein